MLELPSPVLVESVVLSSPAIVGVLADARLHGRFADLFAVGFGHLYLSELVGNLLRCVPFEAFIPIFKTSSLQLPTDTV